MKLVILNNGVPIYEQIKEQVRQAIFSGEVGEGEALPSIRQMARDLKISVITTARAYGDLEAEGLVANVQGKGCFVLPKNEELIREQSLMEIEKGLALAISAAKKANIAKNELYRIFEITAGEENYE